MEIVAFYLPQFHSIPENDEWWGKGFTEWTNVKKGKALFEGHYQPRVPYDNNYYNLLDENVLNWQVKLAEENGLDAFCFYHYWFDGHLLLEKPVEKYRTKECLSLKYCICWANEDWTNAWKAGEEREIFIKQTYGKEADWKNHFEYLLNYFKDPRYLKNDNRPFFIIYRPEIIPCLCEMVNKFREWSIEAGFDGIDIAYQTSDYYRITKGNDNLFDYRIEYQPYTIMREKKAKSNRALSSVYYCLKDFINNHFHLDIGILRKDKLAILDYDVVWREILDRKNFDTKTIPGAFVDWDNTCRKGKFGSVINGATPEKFEKYMTHQLYNAKNKYKSKYIFLFAWNEWGEGGYLEPDEKYNDGYLRALKKAVERNEG